MAEAQQARKTEYASNPEELRPYIVKVGKAIHDKESRDVIDTLFHEFLIQFWSPEYQRFHNALGNVADFRHSSLNPDKAQSDDYNGMLDDMLLAYQRSTLHKSDYQDILRFAAELDLVSEVAKDMDRATLTDRLKGEGYTER